MNFPTQYDIYQNGIESGNLVSIFKKKTERINWKLLAGVDVEKVIQQNDIGVLRENVKHLTFCDIENELEIRDCDKNLVKMFKLAQLTVDYLLTSQEFLANAHNSVEERAQVMAEETEAAKRKLQESEGYISEIKRECHRRKKLILAQQQIMDSGPNAYHRCPYCEKAFLNGTFLQAHLEKRHADRYIKDWYLIENQRKKSPKREHSEERPAEKDKTLELILQKLMEQRRSSPVSQKNYDDDFRRMANEFERERREWQLQMDRLKDEIENLRHQLRLANQKPRSHLKNLEDDFDHSDNMERARQKAIEDHKKHKPIIIPEEPIIQKRVKKPKPKFEEKPSIDDKIKIQTNVNEGFIQPQPEKPKVVSPVHLSPRQTISSPVMVKELPVRDSFKRKSSIVFDDLDNLDNLGIDFTQDLIEKFCNEVRHMLDDHLELHGIQRGTTGIPGSVLNDKIKIMDHEESQLKLKYPNYNDIRRRLEKEVDHEAARRMLQGTEKSVPKKPSLENRIPERVKAQLSSRSLQSSQSEWDDISDARPNAHKQGSPMRIEPPRNMNTENRNAIGKHIQNRSASPSPTRKSNNLRHSSDLSNTLDSSAWPTESKAVTSVAHQSQVPKRILTNRSSDYDDEESNFST